MKGTKVDAVGSRSALSGFREGLPHRSGAGFYAVSVGEASSTGTMAFRIRRNSATPVLGTMTVLRRPWDSSQMRRNRPRGFSQKSTMRCLRSTCNWRLAMIFSMYDFYPKTRHGRGAPGKRAAPYAIGVWGRKGNFKRNGPGRGQRRPVSPESRSLPSVRKALSESVHLPRLFPTAMYVCRHCDLLGLSCL